MSKIFEIENQFIIRFPEKLATRVRELLDSCENPSKPMELQPFCEKLEENGEKVENFGFKYEKTLEKLIKPQVFL